MKSNYYRARYLKAQLKKDRHDIGNRVKQLDSRLFDELLDAFYILDEHWNFTYVNHAAEKLLRRKREDLQGKSIWVEFADLKKPPFYTNFHEAIKQNKSIEFKGYYEPLDTWFNVNATPSNNNLVVQFRDITVVKHAMDESREYYRSLFDHHPDAIFSLNFKGRYETVNRSFENIFEYCIDEVLEMNFYSLIDKNDVEKAIFHFYNASKGLVQNYEVTCNTKTGRAINVHITNFPIISNNKVVGIFGIAKDITTTKVTETVRKKVEENLKLAVEIANLGSWEWNTLDNSVYWSEKFHEIVGSTNYNEKLTYDAFFKVIHPDDREYVKDTLNKTLNGEPLNTQFRVVRPNNEIRYVISLGVPSLDQFGKITKIYGTSQDVTLEKKRQDQLKRSEELFRLISDNSQDVITFSNVEGVFNYISPAVKKVLGYEPSDMIGKNRLDFIHSDDISNVRLKPSNGNDVERIRFRHKKGHYVWLERSMKFIKTEAGKAQMVLGIARDITDRKKAEELMIKSEKLTMAGQLAAGIAHEIRNPLTSIKGFLQLMQQGYELKPQFLDVINSEFNRIEIILSELLLLAKPRAMKYEKKNVYSILKQVVILLETEANFKGVIIHYTESEKVLFINCDENQLKQVFINLIKNGIEAMPQGGEILIKTKQDKDNITLLFIDQGHGIPNDKLEKIGQPFYTTKDKGTGLGLAVSFNIIENHKGMITIESEEGKGTTFMVALPSTIHKPTEM
ncbi:PAS domain S-box protein [Evansella sp. AB-rgal1]|uniref:PAS domain-containing protein n=1 Tax=Evansella sp. AB-rgal1 TaxID=3242696 RepID=UPI00359D83AA